MVSFLVRFLATDSIFEADSRKEIEEKRTKTVTGQNDLS